MRIRRIVFHIVDDSKVKFENRKGRKVYSDTFAIRDSNFHLHADG